MVLGTSLARVVRRVPAGGASLAALSSLLLVAPAVSVAVVVPVDAIAAHYQRHPHKIPMMPPLYGAAAAASVSSRRLVSCDDATSHITARRSTSV